MMPLVGFLPATDPRMRSTIEAIAEHLTEDGFVLRYPTHDAHGANVDGLSGHEGAFLACSFWLADDLAMHATIEEQHFYPAVRAKRTDADFPVRAKYAWRGWNPDDWTEKLMGFKIDDPDVTAFTAIIQSGAVLATLLYLRQGSPELH